MTNDKVLVLLLLDCIKLCETAISAVKFVQQGIKLCQTAISAVKFV